MEFKVTHGGKLLTLTKGSLLEIEQLNLSLTKQVENYHFIKQHLNGWNGITSYFKNDSLVPIGLWNELRTICDVYKFDLNIKGLREIFYLEVTVDEFQDWVDCKFADAVNDEGEPFVPRDYQVDTAYRILKNKLCLSELATSAGKSLIIFMVLMYLQENNLSKKMLMIVPSIDLVIQAYNDFHEYNSFLLPENKFELNIKQIHGGEKKDFKVHENIHVSTYQSLNNLGINYFLEFDTIAIDEAHKTKAHTIKTILGQCKNADRKFGLTGTLPVEGTLDWLTLQAYVGPKVKEIKAKTLQERGAVADLNIAVLNLKYPKDVRDRFDTIKSNSKDGKELLNLEQKFVNQYDARTNYIAKVVGKCEKNQLVLFHKKEFGRNLKRIIEENTDKEVFFINGDIPKDKRTEIIREMKTGKNKVLVASYGTLSTGISINNLHYIHFTESFKSHIIIKQSIGRGLRLHNDKTKLVVFDYVDCLTSDNYNMLSIHAKERQKIYENEQFNYVTKDIILSD